MYSTECSQNGSKLVIRKPGYSIFSECIASRCPMLVIPQKNYPEDKFLCKYTEKFGISNIINMNQNLTVNLKDISTNELFQKINEHEIQKLMNLPSTDFLVNEFLQK